MKKHIILKKFSFLIKSFATGVIIFFLGIIGKYISLIFEEVKSRPLYIIQNHHNKD